MPPNPSEMLSTPRVAATIADVAAAYDYVILDSAPVLPVADSVALARVVDGVLVVTQANRVSARDVRGAFERLERVGAPPIGVVLNRVRAGTEGGYGYGYGYGYRGPQAPSDKTPVA